VIAAAGKKNGSHGGGQTPLALQAMGAGEEINNNTGEGREGRNMVRRGGRKRLPSSTEKGGRS